MARVPAGARAIFRGTGVSPCPPGELGGQGSFFPMGLFLYGSVTSLAACVVDNFRENGIIAEGAFPQRERVKKEAPGCSAVGSAPALGAGCRVFESPHSDQWRAATVTPYPAPSKEGALPLYRILVTAWSLSIQSVLHCHKRVVRTKEGQEVNILLTAECIVLLAPLSVCG